MRAFILAALVAAAAGCSSSKPSTQAQPEEERVRIMTNSGRISMRAAPTVSTSRVALPDSVARVWGLLAGVYDSLRIPITRIDRDRHIMGADQSMVRRALGKTPLSRFLDCGDTQIGPNADSYDIYLTVLTQVDSSADGGSAIQTTVDATAQSPSFGGSQSHCTSRGQLERRIIEMIRTQLGH